MVVIQRDVQQPVGIATAKTGAMTETALSSSPAPQVWPTLQAHDAHALIRCYVEVLGFVAVAVYDDGDQVAHAQLSWPEGGGIMLGSHKPGRAWVLQPGTFGAYVVTDQVADIYARVQAAAGMRIVRELGLSDQGGEEFAIADPEGNLWSFGSYRGEAVG